MEFDYQDTGLTGGVITYPDLPFTNVPVPPSRVKETIVLWGTNAQSTPYVEGIADQPEG